MTTCHKILLNKYYAIILKIYFRLYIYKMYKPLDNCLVKYKNLHSTNTLPGTMQYIIPLHTTVPCNTIIPLHTTVPIKISKCAEKNSRICKSKFPICSFRIFQIALSRSSKFKSKKIFSLESLALVNARLFNWNQVARSTGNFAGTQK